MRRYPTGMRSLHVVSLLSCLCAHPLAGCGSDDSPASDAAPPAVDAGRDAGPPVDAGGPCRAGEVLFTGSYQDWDGNSAGPTNTLGTVVAGAQSSFTINAPNGRVVLCLPAAGTSVVSFTHDDYLPLRYTFDPASAGTAFDIRGLTPGRADELLMGLGVTPDPQLAHVFVAVRMATDNPEAVGAAVTGARVALGNAAAGTFTADQAGVLGAGDTLAGDAFVLFANTELGGGTTTVTVTPPQGLLCTGPETLELAAGELAATTFACAERDPRAR